MPTLVMLSDDLFKIPAEKIKDTNIMWTMVGGKTVWSPAWQNTYYLKDTSLFRVSLAERIISRTATKSGINVPKRHDLWTR